MIVHMRSGGGDAAEEGKKTGRRERGRCDMSMILSGRRLDLRLTAVPCDSSIEALFLRDGDTYVTIDIVI